MDLKELQERKKRLENNREQVRNMFNQVLGQIALLDNLIEEEKKKTTKEDKKIEEEENLKKKDEEKK